MRVLVTFLGGGANRQYRPARYAFSRTEIYETQLFGWALLQHLHAAGEAADRLVVFGTPTSFWEHLLRVMRPNEPEDIAKLASRAKQGVSRRELKEYEPALRAAAGRFGVEEVNVEPIDFLTDTEAQKQFIGRLADLLGPGDRLVLDVTHGLRHQPIVCTVAAMVLRASNRAAIDGIYYGALELTPSQPGAETPVLRLDPLLAFADWIAGLAAADATGDFSRVARLLARDRVSASVCEALAEGCFFAEIGDFAEASQRLEAWRKGIEGTALRGPSALFVDEINRHPLLKARNRVEQLKGAAIYALERGSLVRATELAYEAAYALLAEHGFKDPDEYGNSQSYYDAFKTWCEGQQWENVIESPQGQWRRAFDRLCGMRNRMVHLDYDTQKRPRAADALKSRAAAAGALQADIETLFDPDATEALRLQTK